MALEARGRQAAEVEALASFCGLEFVPGPSLEATQEMIAHATATSDEALAASAPPFEFRVRVSFDDEGANAGPRPAADALLSVVLPTAYLREPASVPVLSLACARFGRDGERRALEALGHQLASLQGEECLFQLVQWLRENGPGFLAAPAPPGPPAPAEADSRVEIARVFIRFHHIYSTEKRWAILEWAGDHRLTGVSRAGKPGLVYVEGDPSDVSAYVARLRGLPWQKMSVASEAREALEPGTALGQARRFRGMKEVASEGLFGLLPLFAGAGLEAAFREAARVPRGAAADAGAGADGE